MEGSKNSMTNIAMGMWIGTSFLKGNMEKYLRNLKNLHILLL